MVLHMGGLDLWMNFLVVESLDDSDHFVLGRDFVRNFDVMIDLNNRLIRIRNPDRKYVKKLIIRKITDENKVPIVLLNTMDTTVTIQRGKELAYALPMRTDDEETENLKRYSVKDCPNHSDKDKILKRIDEFKSINKLFSIKFERDDGSSSCWNFFGTSLVL